eukprot:m.186546 g.186546  ORF g.186546 m.186546 type:complete len:196 (+) comp24765_c2_seq5:67-654(+)
MASTTWVHAIWAIVSVVAVAHHAHGQACSASDFEEKMDYHNGQGMGSAPATDAMDCCTQCANATWQAKGCLFWTFLTVSDAGGPPSCWFKTSKSGERANQDATSGAVNPPPPPSPPPSPPAPPPSPPGPPAPGAPGYWCVQNSTCLYGPQPSPKFKGGTEQHCAAICHPSLYMCTGGQCVASPTGGTLQECNAVC